MSRPTPPAALLGPGATFVPAPELNAWLFKTFIAEDAKLVNPVHHHLRWARLGVLWTNCNNSRGGRSVVAQCEICPPMAMGKWQRARVVQQVEEWFGAMPDFILTFHAGYASIIDDVTFCALCEHELMHAGQDRDAEGAPKFGSDGRPKYAIRGHDVETFVGLAERYGAVETSVAELKKALSKPPSIGKAQIAGACGTCLKIAA